MIIAIIGGRDFTDVELLRESILDENITKIVSGGAKGADTLGREFALKNNIELVEYLPDWKKYGRGAGFIRNKEIIENSDIIYAFWDGKSKGTLHSINIAKKLNKPIRVIRYD